jgi:hypothetical protein
VGHQRAALPERRGIEQADAAAEAGGEIVAVRSPGDGSDLLPSVRSAMRSPLLESISSSCDCC